MQRWLNLVGKPFQTIAESNAIAMTKENQVSTEVAAVPKRGKGRPKRVDATIGRERILEITAEFLRHHSLAELTMVGIAKAANVDPALVRYYFNSKDGLLTELISKLTTESTTSGLRFLSDSGPVDHRLKRRLRTLLERGADNPFYHELLIDRIFRRDDAAARAVLDDLARRALHIANKLMDDTELRRVDPAFLHLMTVGACSFFSTSKPLLDALRQKESTNRTLDEFAEFMADVLLNGLRVRDC